MPDEERVEIGKQRLEDRARRGLAASRWSSNSPASQGVRVVKNNVGNVPERVWNSAVSDNPIIAHPETYFFK